MISRRFVCQALDRLPPGTTLSSELFCRTVGQLLSERAEGPGILRSAYERGVAERASGEGPG